MRLATLFALLLFALAAMGCVPTVQLKSATLRGPSPTGVRFDAVLSVENPNTFDVEITAVRANVRMENVRGYVPVYFEPRVWVPAGRKVLIPVPVTVPWAMVPQIVAATVSQPSVPFTVIGNADVVATRSLRINRNMYEFEEDGELPRSLFLQVGGSGGIFPTLGIGNR